MTSLDECLMLSEHAIILRSILAEVESQLAATPHLLLKPTLKSPSTSDHNKSACEARKLADSIGLQRRKALRDFSVKNVSIDVVRIIGGDQHPCSSQPTSSNKTEILLTPLEFKQRYVWRNIPAIIRGLDDERCGFHNLAKLWRKHNPDGETTIQCSWFKDNVGGEIVVPVRKPLCHTEATSMLDEEGRARECDTAEMSMNQWIQYCHDDTSTSKTSNCSSEEDDKLYLKDWHLMQLAENKERKEEKLTPESAEKKFDFPLYVVPSIFERDILNPFLRKYFGGDYRFTYWGPVASSTALHSDVLNSFSWSFNVVGEKEWTFYCPPSFAKIEEASETLNDGGEEAEGKALSFVITQHEGEAIFVPSGWQHEVRNIKETLSVNHNWVTASSVDQVWECIVIETKSVEDECNQWGIPSDEWDAREAMLRGCIGLNVSMYFFALLLSLIQEISLFNSCTCSMQTAHASQPKAPEDAFECLFNIHCLSKQLQSILQNPSSMSAEYGEAKSVGIYNLQLAQRLSATLMSEELAERALDLATQALVV
eukprot:CAMPEP_0197719836 /NCGR_PEP_ID=MMETSP1434-20131217/3423_1 /TAXON_ID=265543 /ORGANISM="Minutocellus polymorphus, Strain CCMP3303" /LENGTH=539 /DNA_ID=CAMNT_0043304619 /DNA_START=63 /DNA_END=1682 /DNA_ORIENTATION=-